MFSTPVNAEFSNNEATDPSESQPRPPEAPAQAEQEPAGKKEAAEEKLNVPADAQADEPLKDARAVKPVSNGTTKTKAAPKAGDQTKAKTAGKVKAAAKKEGKQTVKTKAKQGDKKSTKPAAKKTVKAAKKNSAPDSQNGKDEL